MKKEQKYNKKEWINLGVTLGAIIWLLGSIILAMYIHSYNQENYEKFGFTIWLIIELKLIIASSFIPAGFALIQIAYNSSNNNKG